MGESPINNQNGTWMSASDAEGRAPGFHVRIKIFATVFNDSLCIVQQKQTSPGIIEYVCFCVVLLDEKPSRNHDNADNRVVDCVSLHAVLCAQVLQVKFSTFFLAILKTCRLSFSKRLETDCATARSTIGNENTRLYRLNGKLEMGFTCLSTHASHISCVTK